MNRSEFCPNCKKTTFQNVESRTWGGDEREVGTCNTCGRSRVLAIDDPKELKMPFGKYKGEKLGDIAIDDPSYLRWSYDNMDSLPERYREAIETLI